MMASAPQVMGTASVPQIGEEPFQRNAPAP